MMIDQKTMKEFQESYEFLSNHPAFADYRNSGMGAFVDCEGIWTVCKNGHALEGSPKTINVNPEDERFQEFVEKADEENISRLGHLKMVGQDSEDGDDEIFYVEVEYADYYGQEWEADHIEVWLESGMKRHFKEDEVNEFGYHTPQQWHDYDLNIHERTLEEAVISMAKVVKKKYGDFSMHGANDISPKWIDEYNKKANPFDRSLEINEMFAKHRKMIDENKYVRLMEHHYNEMWWQLWAKDNLSSFYKDHDEWGGNKIHPVDVSHLIDYDKFVATFK
jgi:hypothetical protein